MALDELTLLVNRCRRLDNDNEDGHNDEKIRELYDKISELLDKSDEKVIVKGYAAAEAKLSDYGDLDWLIDELIENPGRTVRDCIVDDICNNIGDYISNYDEIILEDTNGKELERID